MMAANTTILVVDDEVGVCTILKEFLSNHNFNVMCAISGHEALDIIERQRVDLVLSDLVMPRMDGISLTRLISEFDSSIPVIIMTGYATIDSAVSAIKAGAADFITKPIKFNHALFVVRRVLETQKLREMAKLSEYFKRLSNTDDLTGLHNHRHFKGALKKEIKRHLRYRHHLSLIFVDIDNFKKINDGYGHLVGDQILLGVAELMRHSFRSSDVLSRYGGEEFCVILPETAAEEALVVGKRFVETIFNHAFDLHLNEKGLKISVTAGLAVFPDHGGEVRQLIHAADLALYKGKRSGKNCMCVYEPGDEEFN